MEERGKQYKRGLIGLANKRNTFKVIINREGIIVLCSIHLVILLSLYSTLANVLLCFIFLSIDMC